MTRGSIIKKCDSTEDNSGFTLQVQIVQDGAPTEPPTVNEVEDSEMREVILQEGDGTLAEEGDMHDQDYILEDHQDYIVDNQEFILDDQELSLYLELPDDTGEEAWLQSHPYNDLDDLVWISDEDWMNQTCLDLAELESTGEMVD